MQIHFQRSWVLIHWFRRKLYMKMKKKSLFCMKPLCLCLPRPVPVSFSFNSTSQGALTPREWQCLFQRRGRRPGSQPSQLHRHLLWVPLWGFSSFGHLLFFQEEEEKQWICPDICWVAMLCISDASTLAVGARECARSTVLPGLTESQCVVWRSLRW